MTTLTATIPAWLTSGQDMPHDESDVERAASVFTYWKPHDENYLPDGWVQVGTAEITITFKDQQSIVSGQIDVLNEAKKRIKSETQQKLNAIDEQIGRLTCLEYKP